MKIGSKQAEEILMKDLTQYEDAVTNGVKVPLSDNQFATLVSFTYNVGIGAFRKSTLLKKLNKGDYESVPKELSKWVNAGGKRIDGLVRRRSAEAGLWVKGEFVSSNYVKPEPSKLNLKEKAEVVGPLIGAASGFTGLASGNGPVQWACAIVMVAAVSFGIWFAISRMRDEKA